MRARLRVSSNGLSNLILLLPWEGLRSLLHLTLEPCSLCWLWSKNHIYHSCSSSILVTLASSHCVQFIMSMVFLSCSLASSIILFLELWHMISILLISSMYAQGPSNSNLIDAYSSSCGLSSRTRFCSLEGGFELPLAWCGVAMGGKTLVLVGGGLFSHVLVCLGSPLCV